MNDINKEVFKNIENVNNENIWCKTSQKLPPENVVVETKIDDERGCRNEARLYRQGSLWFFHDGNMYVYYTPTHWRY